MDVLGGLVRLALGVILGGLVTKGIITKDQLEQIITLLLAAAGIVAVGVWSVATNTLKAMLEKVAKSDEVKKIETDAGLANSLPSPKVVPADPVRDLQ